MLGLAQIPASPNKASVPGAFSNCERPNTFSLPRLLLVRFKSTFGSNGKPFEFLILQKILELDEKNKSDVFCHPINSNVNNRVDK